MPCIHWQDSASTAFASASGPPSPVSYLVLRRPLAGLATLFCLLLLAEHAYAELTLAPCTLTGSQGYGQVEAQCGRLRRAENPDQPAGPQIQLFVARIKSLSPDPRADAFTIINGGPGASSVSLYADMANAFAGILRERDIVIVDQRGTGRSNPLDCRDLEQASQEYSEEIVRAATHQCLESISADPRFYATSQAVADLDAVRQALGYSTLNIYGVSYGTRVALHYLRRHPKHVRALVIDGVVPPDLALGVNVAENAQLALDGIFQRCREDADCAERFSDLAQTFAELRDDLQQQAVTVDVAHPVTGISQSMEFGYDHLALTIRLLSYAPETAALIPLIISETSRGNYTPAASQALKIVDQLNGAISFGMHNSVVCSEDLPFVSMDDIDWPRLENTYLGADQIRALSTICELWPRAPVDPQFKEPLRADAPVLILSGENDPVTPPIYGERVSSSLSNALHVVGHGQGHGMISRGCTPRLVTQFIEAGSWKELDVSCAARLSASPFFINLLGPAP
jgi:pimeloyl-ACP methyl ester carboxylesterase